MSAQGNTNELFTKEFLSKMSHHSRSPFNGLLGFAELLLLNQNKLKSESATDYLLRINMLAKRAFISSENINLFLKIYSKNLTPVISSALFSSILEQSYNLNKEAFKLKEVEFVKELDESLFINCDAFLTGNILSNVLSKALKLCEDGSVVTFSSSVTKQKNVFSIAYTGMQIESETVQEFFTKTASPDNLFSPELDIELWLCYQLATAQNMHFGLTISNNNQTTFSLVV